MTFVTSFVSCRSMSSMPCCSLSAWRVPSISTRPPQHRKSAARTRLGVYAIGWDPEGILSAPKGGHIQRRLSQKQQQANEQYEQEMEKQRAEARAALEAKRAARVLPASHEEIVAYLLETEANEMEYEVARCKPLLTPEFMQHLERCITTERLGSNPDEERVAELSMLQQYLEEALAALDAVTKTMTAPADRLRRLLTAKDKAAMLYEMAGNNEIDQPLIELLDQNIASASMANNEDAVVFLTKIRDAARKFVLT